MDESGTGAQLGQPMLIKGARDQRVFRATSASRIDTNGMLIRNVIRRQPVSGNATEGLGTADWTYSLL